MICVENVGAQVNRKLRLGRVRLGVADSAGSKRLADFARMTVEHGSLIRTDGARLFRVLAANEGYSHDYISGYSSPEGVSDVDLIEVMGEATRDGSTAIAQRLAAVAELFVRRSG
jgi:hypothetical protein